MQPYVLYGGVIALIAWTIGGAYLLGELRRRKAPQAPQAPATRATERHGATA